MNQGLLIAFGLTLLAGLSTGIGSAIALFAKRTSKGFLSACLGFSGGVMLYVSFTELLTEATEHLSRETTSFYGRLYATLAFFAGIAVIGLIDRLVPEAENPHEVPDDGTFAEADDHQSAPRLARMGLFTALAIAIHNFPEGLATFAAALNDPQLGVAIAVAIALHNIPEGIAVSVPIYYATGSRSWAFWLSLLSGLSEPVGAVLGYFLLRPFFTDALLGWLLGGVAGIMVFISLDELLPTARAYGRGHVAVYAMVAGMAVMALSLLAF